MLCPELTNFPPPKVITFSKKFENFDRVAECLLMNHFYNSLVVTCPDELQTPGFIEDSVVEDSEYYKITDCSLVEFMEPVFVEKFVKKGKFYCLSSDRNCIAENCAAITPDGVLTIHILEYIYQTIGLEGIKRPHNFYEVKIDLKDIKHDKLKKSLEKLGDFNFNLSWEPNEEDICPSSIAKYFYERNISVSVHSLQVQKITPSITNVPAVKDVDVEEMVEWVGMLAHEADLDPKEPYISTYCSPESEFSLETSRISLLIVKGFITPTTVINVSRNLNEYVISRELENYWTSISVQSDNNLWQWNWSSPKMFQAHDSSCTVFFTKDSILLHSIGQLKYS